MGGSRSGPTRVLSSMSSARFSDRYPARNTTRITLRISDGWPATRPDGEDQPHPVDLAPEQEHEQEQRDADRGPGVLVEPQPRVGPHDRADHAHDRQREEQPSQLHLAE